MLEVYIVLYGQIDTKNWRAPSVEKCLNSLSGRLVACLPMSVSIPGTTRLDQAIAVIVEVSNRLPDSPDNSGADTAPGIDSETPPEV